MLLPYGDNLTSGIAFFGVLLFVAIICVLDVPTFLDASFNEWTIRNLGFVPFLFSVSPWSNIHTLVSSVFLHRDVFHLIGNCLFLWTFGRSLERLFGFSRFMAAFPFLGVVGLLAHWALFPNSLAPVIGASGAIAMLMGAYLALFPGAKMKMVLFLGVFFKRFRVPAWTFLLYWAVVQLFSLVFGSGGESGVAYAVHVGGFAAGVLSAMIWKVSYPFAEERLSDFVRSALATRQEASSS